jgi:hypothetical protein
MKIKNDFITNSSSTSFVVIGTWLKRKVLQRPHKGPEEDIYNRVERVLQGSDLTYSFGADYCTSYNGSQFMVGIEYTNMKDNETLAEFKDRVKKQIKEKLGITAKVEHIQECWMDN